MEKIEACGGETKHARTGARAPDGCVRLGRGSIEGSSCSQGGNTSGRCRRAVGAVMYSTFLYDLLLR